MTNSRNYEERAEQLLQPIIDKHGFELVDVEYVKEAGTWFLRAFIDKEGGITIDDCEVVSAEHLVIYLIKKTLFQMLIF